MKIGFDLDQIFIDTPPLIPSSVINKLYKKKDNGILLYRIPSKPEQTIRQVSHFQFFRPPIQQNMTFLKNLDHKKNQYYLISSRFSFLRQKTQQIIQKYGFNKHFTEMYFNYEDNQPHLFKNEILQKLKLAAYVDDDLSLLKFVAKNNPETRFFWYNKTSTDKISDNLQGITHLDTLFSILEKHDNAS